MTRRGVVALAVAPVGYAVAMGLISAFSSRLMYPAPRERAEPVVAHGAVLRIAGPGGRTVHVLHVPAPDGEPTIVHFHGNGEALVDQAGLATRFHENGVGFYAVEYPGYGLSSEAAPSERAIYEDAESALEHLGGALHVPASSVVLEGQSLGTGVAVEMARRGHGSRLVLISPYTSMLDMARLLVPFLPVGLLVRDRYETVTKAPGIRIPTLIVHGTRDEIIPVAMGRQLSGLFPDARLRLLEGAHHNDVWTFGPRLVADIVEFARGPAAARDGR